MLALVCAWTLVCGVMLRKAACLTCTSHHTPIELCRHPEMMAKCEAQAAALANKSTLWQRLTDTATATVTGAAAAADTEPLADVQPFSFGF